MRIMGLDISTTTIGIAVLDYDGYNSNLIHLDHYKPEAVPPRKSKALSPDHTGTELSRLLKAKHHILGLAKDFNVTDFAVEEYIQFMKGGSGAKTIIPLALMNRTICLGIYETYHIYPNIISVLSIRHCLKKTKVLPKKEEIPELVASILGIEFPWEYKKKSEKPIVENYDRADAVAVALAYVRKKYEYIRSSSVVKPTKRSKPGGSKEGVSDDGSKKSSGRKQGTRSRGKVQEDK